MIKILESEVVSEEHKPHLSDQEPRRDGFRGVRDVCLVQLHFIFLHMMQRSLTHR